MVRQQLRDAFRVFRARVIETDGACKDRSSTQYFLRFSRELLTPTQPQTVAEPCQAEGVWPKSATATAARIQRGNPHMAGSLEPEQQGNSPKQKVYLVLQPFLCRTTLNVWQAAANTLLRKQSTKKKRPSAGLVSPLRHNNDARFVQKKVGEIERDLNPRLVQKMERNGDKKKE